MANKPREPKFNLDQVRNITVGPEASGRKHHNKSKPDTTGQHFDLANAKGLEQVTAQRKRQPKVIQGYPQATGNKQRPGEVYSAKTPPKEQDRLDRELIKSSRID